MRRILFSLLLMITLISTVACSKEKDYVLGNINSKEMTAKDFRKYLVKEYGFKEEDLALDKVKSIFKDYYTTFVFMKEGESNKYFDQKEFLDRLEKRKVTVIKQQIDRLLWEKELQPQIKIDDKEYEPYLKKAKVKHILAISEGRGKPKALEMIEKIKKEVTKENFSELAKKYSEDPGSKDKGGDLGWVDGNTPFVTNFKNAVFAGKAGEIVGPVETEYGYHLIYIEEESRASLSDIKKDKKIKDSLEKGKARDLAKTYMDQLKAKYKDKVHYYPERIQDVKKNKDLVFYSVDGASSMTVDEITKLMGPNLAKYQKDMTEVNIAVQEKLIASDIRYLEGLSKGYDKDESISKKLNYDLNNYKGNIYQSYFRDVFQKKAESQTTEAEIKQYYEKNKEQFKEGEKDPKPVPFEKAKQWIKNDLVSKKAQEEMAGLQKELFKKYKVEFKD